jgi:hypothetical protein
MRIETVNINITNSQSSVARAFIESMLRSAEPDEPTPTVESAAASDIQAPQIGEYWKGQGGIYAGVCRGLNGEKDYPLILSIEIPTSELDWSDSLKSADSITADGHQDFHVPTKEESALLYANLKDRFSTDNWYWTSTQHSEADACVQYFDYGDQRTSSKSYERRCCFVRRLVL